MANLEFPAFKNPFLKKWIKKNEYIYKINYIFLLLILITIYKEIYLI